MDRKRVNRKIKWIATALALITFFVIGGEKHSTPLSNRAMAVGLGIDLTESGYEISTQILSASGKDSGTNDSRVVTAESKTISGALLEISETISKVVSLSHCNTVVLGYGVINDDCHKVLNFLIRNAYLSENALLLTTEGTAKDILSTPVAFMNTAPFYTQQIVGVYASFSDIAKLTVKDFIVRYYCDKSTNCIPIIRKEVAERPIIPQGGSSDLNPKEYLFDLSHTAVIIGNKYVYTEDGTGTTSINFVTSDIGKGTMTYETIDGCFVELHLVSKKNKKKYDAEKNSCKIEVELLLVLREIMNEKNPGSPIERLELKEEDTARLEEKLSGDIVNTFERAKAKGADVLSLCDGMARRKRVDSIDINNLKVEVNVKVKFK